MRFTLAIASAFLTLAVTCSAVGVRTSKPNQNWDYSYSYKKSWLGSKKWFYGSATFYDFTGNSGACGFPWSVADGHTAAVPDARWGDFLTYGVSNWLGASCGSCYRVKCLGVPRYANTDFCKTSKSVLVKIIDYDVPGSWHGGKSWPNNHFDLQPKTFDKIAHKSAGIINIKFTRGYCKRTTPKWTLSPQSQMFWKDVVVFDVPGVGTVHTIFAKPCDRNQWYRGKRGWGSHYTFLGGATFDQCTKVLIMLGEGRGALVAKFQQWSG